MEEIKNRAFILLGSNLGDRLNYLKKALTEIRKVGTILNESSFFKTEPWEMNTDNWFINQVIEIETKLPAKELMHHLLEIELIIGRNRTMIFDDKYASRIIDLDLLYYNDLVEDSVHLTLPHPKLHQRKFTLLPLCEIAPDFQHPIFKQTQLQLLNNCKDQSKVFLQ